MRDLEQGSHLIEAPTSLRAKNPVTITVPASFHTVHTKSKSTSSRKPKSNNDDMEI